MTYSAEDYRHGMPPRMMGTETEYTLQQALYTLHLFPEELLACSVVNRSLWPVNGGRVYIDHVVLESATPECRNPYEVATYELAGEEMVRGLAQIYATANDASPGVYKRTGYSLVTSGDEDLFVPGSVGHHENYSHGTTKHNDTRALAAYLATRIIWSGTGLVTPDGLSISQKADSIAFGSENHTKEGQKRPFLFHGDGRLEVRTGEGNMSPWVIVQKLAMTSLVLRLLEHGVFPYEHELSKLSDEDERMRSISAWPNSRIGGKTATAVQRSIARAGLALADRYPVPRIETQAAEEIIRVCDAVDAIFKDQTPSRGVQFLDVSPIAGEVDWAAKLMRMKSLGLDPKDITTRNLVAVKHDLEWEDIDPSGPARRWYERRQQPAMIDPRSISDAMTTPPPTRAQARTAVLRSERLSPVTGVDWGEVSTPRGTYTFPDPHSPNRVEYTESV